MYLIINGYEFGQFLRVLLWVGLPGMMFLTMLTTWIRYRRSRMTAQLLLRIEGMDEGDVFSIEPEDQSKDESNDVGGDERVDVERSVTEGEEDYKENLYKGILWMKEKYEQYRDLADERHERLKDQLSRMEKKYEDLLAQVRSASPGLLEAGGTAAVPAAVFVAAEPELMSELPERGPREFSGGTEIVVERAEAGADRIRIRELEEQLARTQQRFDEEVSRFRHQLDEEIARGRRLKDEKNAGFDANRLLEQQLLYSSRQLEEKQRMIADMEGQQSIDRSKIEELVTKLRNNSQLLMNIYQELDKSLHFNDGPPRD